MARTALVTGGNRGIGLACCRTLAGEGWRVLLAARSMEKAREAVDGIDGEVVPVMLDVAADDAVGAARAIEGEHGAIDALINNAGVHYDTHQSTLAADWSIIREATETNLHGPWRTAQALAPGMRERGWGRIVNVSSGSGALTGMGSGTPAYSVTKAALNALTIKLAAELRGTGVLVNAVCPGWVRTDMGGASATRSLEEGAESVLWGVRLDDDGPTGGFFRDGERVEW